MVLRLRILGLVILCLIFKLFVITPFRVVMLVLHLPGTTDRIYQFEMGIAEGLNAEYEELHRKG